jgi:transcriptional regulator with XRE-family HTH domain
MSEPSPIRYVRKHVFDVTQAELARIGQVSRSRVSRYESGREAPPYAFLEKLRDEAKKRKITLSAEWFFEHPDEAA